MSFCSRNGIKDLKTCLSTNPLYVKPHHPGGSGRVDLLGRVGHTESVSSNRAGLVASGRMIGLSQSGCAGLVVPVGRAVVLAGRFGSAHQKFDRVGFSRSGAFAQFTSVRVNLNRLESSRN